MLPVLHPAGQSPHCLQMPKLTACHLAACHLSACGGHTVVLPAPLAKRAAAACRPAGALRCAHVAASAGAPTAADRQRGVGPSLPNGGEMNRTWKLSIALELTPPGQLHL